LKLPILVVESLFATYWKQNGTNLNTNNGDSSYNFFNHTNISIIKTMSYEVKEQMLVKN
jgi:hypothetical protein